MKKIVLFGNTTWSMIKFRQGLIKKLLEQNFQVIVVSPFDDYVKDIKNMGCKYIDIKIDNKGSNPIKDLKLVLSIKKIYNEVKPDLIIQYTIKPNIYGTMAAKLSNVKSIAVVTGLGYTFINKNFISKVAKWLYKFSFKFSTKVFFINEDDQKEFINNNLVCPLKTVLISGEGINTKIFQSSKNTKKDDTFRFLLIARMLFDKGVVEYVESAEILKQKYKDIEVGLLGYLDVSNPKAVTKKQMKKWEKEKNIIFYGSTDDVKPYIIQSDCIVLPSYREGISMTLMESASMEKPLIATNVPGCRDIIDDGVNGYLCEVRNSKDLALKMEKMINHSEYERNKMGKAGREKMIREFEQEIVINKYLMAIKEILSD